MDISDKRYIRVLRELYLAARRDLTVILPRDTVGGVSAQQCGIVGRGPNPIIDTIEDTRRDPSREPRASRHVMDNVAIHRVAGVREAIKAADATLRYMPSYSPDLNTINRAVQ